MYRLSDSHPFTDDDLATVLFGVDPRTTYNPGAERVTTLSGTTADVGYARSVWTFAALTIEQWEALLDIVGGYSGEVYVEVRDDIDDWYEYRAIARLPEPRTLDRWGGYYQNVSIEFVLIEDVTPP
jgi:hypothetical protein